MLPVSRLALSMVTDVRWDDVRALQLFTDGTGGDRTAQSVAAWAVVVFAVHGDGSRGLVGVAADRLPTTWVEEDERDYPEGVAGFNVRARRLCGATSFTAELFAAT